VPDPCVNDVPAAARIGAEESGNQLLAAILSNLADRVRIISLLGWQARPAMEDEYGQHESILEAAEAGDAELAGERMRQHIHDFTTLFQGEMAAQLRELQTAQPPSPRRNARHANEKLGLST
jgi:DNA-binding FadR family transcriptional regulator